MIRAILQSAEQFSISAYQRHMFLKFGVESFVVWCTSVVMFLSQKKETMSNSDILAFLDIDIVPSLNLTDVCNF